MKQDKPKLNEDQLRYREGLGLPKKKRGRPSKIITGWATGQSPFEQHWQQYIRTEGYWDMERALHAAGIKHPYAENILHRAYAAGYWEIK